MKSHVIVKVALLCATLAITFLAGKESLALALGSRNPQLAVNLNPRQADALASLAHSNVSRSPTPEEVAAARKQALKALEIDAMNVRAVASLAIMRPQSLSDTRALEWMTYGEGLSRRNLPVQLWWIEHWSSKGNVSRALMHYDIAMRTTGTAPSILFPILMRAVANPIVSSRLVEVLSDDPPWAEQFVQQLAQSGTAEATYRLLTDLAVADYPASGRAFATAIDRLIEVGQLQEAWSLFEGYRGSEAQQPLRNREFSNVVPEPTAFDWQLSQSSISAMITDEGLLLRASPGAGGVAASQTVALASGPHTIEMRYELPDGAASEPPVLSVRCVSGGELGRSRVRGQGTALVAFRVPSGCTLQRLNVSFHDDDSGRGTSSLVHAVSLID